MRKRLFYLFCPLLVILSLTGCAKKAENTPAPAGPVLSVTKGQVNPQGNLDSVYYLNGDAISEGVTIDDSEKLLPAKSNDAPTALRVFHMNDTHSYIMNFSSAGDTHNLAQMKKLVDDAKAGASSKEAFLWVTAGDDHIGTMFDELMGSNASEFQMSAPYKAYTAAGIDAVGLGNHEFDKLTPILSKAIEQDAGFPVISSNITGSKYQIKDAVAAIGVEKNLRIGFISLTIPKETKLHTTEDPDLTGNDPIETVKSLIPAMESYCDVFVVMSHLGYEASDRYTIESGDAAVASAVGELTKKPAIVVGGHTHTILNESSLSSDNVYNGVPVAEAGQYGNYLGDASIDMSGSTPSYTASLRKILSGKPSKDGSPNETESDYDTAFQTSVIDPIRDTLNVKMLQTLGHTDDTQLVDARTTQYDRYVSECAMANFITDAMVKRSANFPTGPVDFACVNATGVAGLTSDSTITYGDMYGMFPYADTLCVVTVTGQTLKDIIENNAPRVSLPSEFQENGGTLDSSTFVEKGFLHFSSGIRYKIQLGDTAVENKAVDITLNGQPIDSVLDQQYNMLLYSYLAIGRGGWQGEAVGQGLPDSFIGYNLKQLCTDNAVDLGLVFRAELLNYIRDDSQGLIGADSGVIKDGRLDVTN